MNDKETRDIRNKYEDEILELIDNRDNFTRSDLQGVVMALVQTIIAEGKVLGGKELLKCAIENS